MVTSVKASDRAYRVAQLIEELELTTDATALSGDTGRLMNYREALAVEQLGALAIVRYGDCGPEAIRALALSAGGREALKLKPSELLARLRGGETQPLRVAELVLPLTA